MVCKIKKIHAQLYILSSSMILNNTFEENKFVRLLVSFFTDWKNCIHLNILNIKKMETIQLRQINMNCHETKGKCYKNT